jgi:hypothetical protein
MPDTSHRDALPDDVVDSYKETLFEVALPTGPAVFSVSSTPETGQAFEQPLTVVTAFNPALKRQGHWDNEQANRSLEQYLQSTGKTYFPAVGYSPDRSHEEPSFAVAGLTRDEARDLGARFGQACVFYWDGRRGQLVWCD